MSFVSPRHKKNSDHEREGGADGEPVTWDAFCCVNKIAFLTRALRWAHRNIFLGNQSIFFGNGIVTIEMFEKMIFQIMCHMMSVTTIDFCLLNRLFYVVKIVGSPKMLS